jgi:hypothetical protein
MIILTRRRVSPSYLLLPPPLTRQAFEDIFTAQDKTRKMIKDIVNYADRFGHVLQSRDASVLMIVSPRNRHHAMTALANLAKFTGQYDDWMQIKRRYSLKWSKGVDAMQAFEKFFDPNMTIESMIRRVKVMIEVLPPHMGQVIKFACLVGLRPTEVCDSVRLLNSSSYRGHYYNEERQELQHFRFPDLFIRQTKKASKLYNNNHHHDSSETEFNLSPYHIEI